MKKFLKTTWAALLYLWQLPQNLLGLAYLAFCFDRVKITGPCSMRQSMCGAA